MRKRTTMLAAVTAAMLGGFVAPAVAATSTMQDRGQTKTSALTDVDFNETSGGIAQQLMNVGTRDPSFGEVTIDAPAHKLYVWRTVATPTLAYDSVDLKGAALEFRHSLLSSAQENQEIYGIMAAKSALAAAGVNIVSVMTSSQGPSGPIEVGVSNLGNGASVPSMLAAVQAASPLGPAVVTVVAAAANVPADRQSDTPPWIAGDRTAISANGGDRGRSHSDLGQWRRV